MHQLHDGRGTVLYDDCDECAIRARDLGTIDNESLERLALLAQEVKLGFLANAHLSVNEQIAIGELRRMARIVEASGIRP